jgi:hypothetical protein
MSLLLPAHIRKEMALKRHCEQWARDLLWKHYPHHLFTVTFQLHDHSFRIDHALMASSKACMYVHPGEDDLGKALVRVAGEVLERVGIKRGAIEDYAVYDAAAGKAKEAFACR